MKLRFFTPFFLFIALTFNVCAASIFNYDGKTVNELNITIKQSPIDNESSEKEKVKQSMQTKVGAPFDQKEFDQDLKALYETGDYSEIIPEISVKQGHLNIQILLKPHPAISKVLLNGNKQIKEKKLRKELGIKQGQLFKREEINESVNNLSDYLVKKGYYSSRVDYTVESGAETNTVYLYVNIYEGPLAHIQKIIFDGFTPKEERDLRKMIQVKKHNLFSFLTGSGIYKDDLLEADTQTIIKFMQNEGYADAKVNITVKKESSGLFLEVTCERGDVFYIKSVDFQGNREFNEQTLREVIPIKLGSVFSPDELKKASETIREYYTKRSYIDTSVQYRLQLVPSTKEYNVTFEIFESQKYRVGMIIVRGNNITKKSTILHGITLTPGDEFDSTQLQSTQQKLMAMGFFKSVSVYAVKAAGDRGDKESYRNVIIEVEETQTGSVSAFIGASTTQKVFGGIDLAENNFNIEGLTNWSRGLSGLRGGGQYAQVRVQIGENETLYSISWLNPHMMDTLWQFGVDTSYARSHVQSPDYSIHTFNWNMNAGYPLTRYLRFLSKFRAKNTLLHQTSSNVIIPPEQFANSGVITGWGAGFMYDSRNRPIRPHKGIYSAIEGEFAAMIKKNSSTTPNSAFPFLKLNYNNAAYYPLWKLGTLKGRAELKFLQALNEPTADNIPIGEKFFLGGEATVRGYKPASIGPQFDTTSGNKAQNPQGGVSSFLFSVEYIQNIFRSLDAFVFFDSGSISADTYSVGEFMMSYGVGISFDIGRGAPFIIGYGIPINPVNKDQVENFFFSFGGQF